MIRHAAQNETAAIGARRAPAIAAFGPEGREATLKAALTASADEEGSRLDMNERAARAFLCCAGRFPVCLISGALRENCRKSTPARSGTLKEENVSLGRKTEFTVRISDDVKIEIERAAAEAQRSLGWAVREALEAWVAHRKRNAAARAKRRSEVTA